MRQYLLGACIVLCLAVLVGLMFAVWSFADRLSGPDTANVTIGAFKEEAVAGLALTEAKRAFDRGAAVFVDARSALAYKAGHIPGAVRLSAQASTSRLRRALVSYPSDTRIIAYCAGTGCRTSHALAKRLVAKLGYREVEVLEGGWPAWQNAGFPVREAVP